MLDATPINWLYAVLALVGGYAFGSVPFGLVLTRMAGLGDIRKIGSGNIGATNVLRTGNKPLAAATLLLDGGKGAIAVLLAGLASPHIALFAGIGALLGHVYPVWLGFKGGKGVATTLGTLIAFNPIVGLGCCATWLLVAFLFRISSLSALVALALGPVYAGLLTGAPTSPSVLLAVFAAALVWVRHKDNIGRILNGTEPKIGKKKQAEGTTRT